jgi:hypothetical protein
MPIPVGCPFAHDEFEKGTQVHVSGGASIGLSSGATSSRSDTSALRAVPSSAPQARRKVPLHTRTVRRLPARSMRAYQARLFRCARQAAAFVAGS